MDQTINQTLGDISTCLYKTMSLQAIAILLYFCCHPTLKKRSVWYVSMYLCNQLPGSLCQTLLHFHLIHTHTCYHHHHRYFHRQLLLPLYNQPRSSTSPVSAQCCCETCSQYSSSRCHVKPLLRGCNWPPIRHSVHYKLCMLVNRCVYREALSYLVEMVAQTTIASNRVWLRSACLLYTSDAADE